MDFVSKVNSWESGARDGREENKSNEPRKLHCDVTRMREENVEEHGIATAAVALLFIFSAGFASVHQAPCLHEVEIATPLSGD